MFGLLFLVGGTVEMAVLSRSFLYRLGLAQTPKDYIPFYTNLYTDLGNPLGREFQYSGRNTTI